MLERANQGEEIVIMGGNEIYARIGPADGGKRPFGLLRQRGRSDDLFDESDAEQAAIDAGDWNEDVGVWQGGPPVPSARHEAASRWSRGLLLDDRQRPAFLDGAIADRGQGQDNSRQRRLVL
ncbi:hypothetical protein BN77_p11441 [Rhizobium mesoamericanum STM3625]|uniref:Uncharacterized protein n=1 Tax=Rhizobium mesoamericanum STM3625 TaxID=1211777 RepID=K0PQ69_9HYPH|nr:hypothetical protein BN77_p11441 [Rhizobium mesoamericanum STM3625]